jgi:DNA invertase Pin-like site-specific DNA recombinase
MNAPQAINGVRAALYLRVSTARQAEHDVSIPDQRKQGEAYCASRGLALVETFVEAGASAMNDKRPEFQRMIEAGTSRPPSFDIVVVHSFSRFFRDHFELEFYVRKLAKNGVKLVSITQEMGDDPMHVMMRQIMALFDEYQSKENAKHVLRAMNENARQGFWNGALPPIGYRIVAAEQRGAKTKKKLEIDPLHADTVRLIYRLFLEGDGNRGPLGVKAIACYLNERSIFTRDGGRWGLAQIHTILTRTTYIGEHRFNTRSHKDREKKPKSEVVTMAVPPLIDRDLFDAVQARLKSRNPKRVPARVTTSPVLLTGICFCARCGGAMTLRTGTAVLAAPIATTPARPRRGRARPGARAARSRCRSWMIWLPYASKTACSSPSGWNLYSLVSWIAVRSAPSAAGCILPNSTNASPRPSSGSTASTTQSRPAWPIWRTQLSKNVSLA